LRLGAINLAIEKEDIFLYPQIKVFVIFVTQEKLKMNSIFSSAAMNTTIIG
jgi:hypothetical protein